MIKENSKPIRKSWLTAHRINKIAAGIFTTVMIYLIVAGSSGILMWLLSLSKVVFKYQYWISAKPGWGWIVRLNVMIQQPRYIYTWFWHHHPIITSIISYIFGAVVIFAMNYSEKDTEESEAKLLRKISRKIRDT